MEKEEIKELVNKAKKDDIKAFERLYEYVYKDLYRFAFYTLKNQHDAEDVVGEVIVDAFEGIKKLRKEEAFKSWLFKILTNKCKNKLKQYINKTEEINENIISSMPDMAEAYDVKQAFMQLSEEEKIITSMYVFGGYQGKEIAGILHMNYNTVRSKQKRALEKLHKILCE